MGGITRKIINMSEAHTTENPNDFSDYVVFVDESGDANLSFISEDYPLFVLLFCVINKQEYTRQITPDIRDLKFATFGHDMVVLHEHDIRKKKGAFSSLGKEQRDAFMSSITQIIEKADFTLIAVVIDKLELKQKHAKPENPYHLAMELGLERLQGFLRGKNQENKTAVLVCEARGAKEDAALELEFRRICDGKNFRSLNLHFDIVIADKRSNSEGLQLADLIARPIGVSHLKPEQSNHAVDVLHTKWLRGTDGKIDGYGLKVFP